MTSSTKPDDETPDTDSDPGHDAPGIEATKTEHPTGEDQARENAKNEPFG
jgi:hypothetical protein